MENMGLGLNLQRVLTTVEALGPSYHGEAARVQELVARWQQGALRLAVLGQFKRGKSTLINALLGAKLFPSTVLPATALPTFIRWGGELTCEISYLNGELRQQALTGEKPPSDWLQHFVAEEMNPRAARQNTQRALLRYQREMTDYIEETMAITHQAITGAAQRKEQLQNDTKSLVVDLRRGKAMGPE